MVLHICVCLCFCIVVHLRIPVFSLSLSHPMYLSLSLSLSLSSPSLWAGTNQSHGVYHFKGKKLGEAFVHAQEREHKPRLIVFGAKISFRRSSHRTYHKQGKRLITMIKCTCMHTHGGSTCHHVYHKQGGYLITMAHVTTFIDTRMALVTSTC